MEWILVAAQLSLSVTAGQIGITDHLDQPQWYGLEVHGAPVTRFALAPGAGLSRGACGATFAHVNVRKTFWLSERWGLVHHFGPGYFRDCEQIRLGNRLVFRTGLELAYRTRRDHQLAVGFTHLSNAGLGYPNPGTETMAFTYTLPL